jgi:predicted lactoylglutathione lyase
MAITLGMVVLYVRDLTRSIAFYRQLGLDVPDPHPDRPVSACRLAGGVTLILTTGEVATRFDPGWTPPEGGGYRQVLEFVVAEAAEVDALWQRLTSAGHPGRTAPAPVNGPYAAMVDDPDGNVVLITNDDRAGA